MRNAALEEFRSKYLLNEDALSKEREMIFAAGKLPDDLWHQWNRDVACLSEELSRGSTGIPEEGYSLYFDTVTVFLKLRYPLLLQVGDYFNAFGLSYSIFFCLLEYTAGTVRKYDLRWRTFAKACRKEWKVLFLQMSREALRFFWRQFWVDLDALFASGVYAELDAKNYVHFLTLPWPEEFCRTKEAEFRHVFGYYDQRHPDILRIAQWAKDRFLLCDPKPTPIEEIFCPFYGRFLDYGECTDKYLVAARLINDENAVKETDRDALCAVCGKCNRHTL